MAHSPSEERIRAFAELHRLTEDQARRLLTDHGEDDDKLTEAVRNIEHFFRAPS